jgi:hypothetical protein
MFSKCLLRSKMVVWDVQSYICGIETADYNSKIASKIEL